ncbi:hypothetical protein [Metabacillus endolithicus]|uniref:Uncharacterized protein n=1 Tax=Metabacillus endolithicus TaxID=1535204 RepID=A0ABW5BXJ2_9BACI|nr:hypothetical protein [Metabacillus endolithicus]UPG65415.1 hypothetical protein MVE64_10845 [Metabacillus endolithicus]
MQGIFETFYSKSQEGQNIYHIIEIMAIEKNIRLAYRNFKRSTGSKTAGVDRLTKKLGYYVPVSEIGYIDETFQLYFVENKILVKKLYGKLHEGELEVLAWCRGIRSVICYR